MVSVAAV